MVERAQFANVRPEELMGKFRSKEDIYRYFTEHGTLSFYI
jgi:hypothetical protein